jgi:metal-dependent amidase/aminoacylase/carboxypeptidase family protein
VDRRAGAAGDEGQWHGTLMFIAQPAEEKVSGARHAG